MSSSTVPAPVYSSGTPGTVGQVVFKHTGTHMPMTQAYLDGDLVGSFSGATGLTVNNVTVNAAHEYYLQISGGARVPPVDCKMFSFVNRPERKVILGLKVGA